MIYDVDYHGYLIFYAAHALVPQRRVSVQVATFANDVLSNLYAFHRYTGNSSTLDSSLVYQFKTQFQG
jgi:hypothetical protein